MQASAEISMVLNKKVLSMVGREEKDRPRSDNASMGRKCYMGSCREGSVLMTNRMVQLPRIAMRYVRQIGKEIQMCTPSSPGIPTNRNVEIAASEALRGSIINRSLTYLLLVDK